VALCDADLIARVLERDDRHAFAELVRRYQSQIRSFLRRLANGNAAFADDLAQETFLRAYRGLKGFRGGARVASWLFSIAYRVFLSARAKVPQIAAVGPEPEDPQLSVSEALSLRQELNRALGALGPEERAVLALACGMEATLEEIAAALEMPLGTVKSHVRRGKEALRRRLKHLEKGAAS
jgi:RNA polymerase sigma factor (sigma-70 family)